MEERGFFTKYTHYAIIFILSLVMLVVFPMFGTELDMAFNIPNTPIGWAIFIMSALGSAVLNMLIFHSFIQQGKVNVSNDPHYLAANELLRTANFGKSVRYMSPHEWLGREYRFKGTTLAIFSVLGVITFGQAILTYDLMKLISQAFTLLVALVGGVLEMKKVEEFWTTLYPRYAEQTVRELKDAEQESLLNEARAKLAEEERLRKEKELLLIQEQQEAARKEQEALARAARIKELQEALQREQELLSQGETTQCSN